METLSGLRLDEWRRLGWELDYSSGLVGRVELALADATADELSPAVCAAIDGARRDLAQLRQVVNAVTLAWKE